MLGGGARMCGGKQWDVWAVLLPSSTAPAIHHGSMGFTHHGLVGLFFKPYFHHAGELIDCFFFSELFGAASPDTVSSLRVIPYKSCAPYMASFSLEPLP